MSLALSPRRARAVLFVVLASSSVLAASPAPATAQGEGEIPAWLSPALGGSPAKAAAKLRERFGKAFAFKKGDAENAETTEARTCEQLLPLARSEDYLLADETQVAMNELNAQVSACERLQLAGSAKPSRQSFLKGFKLGPAAASELPASVEERPSSDYAALVREADATGTSLASFVQALGGKLDKSMEGEELVLIDREPGAPASAGARMTLRLEGRGDFNGDGIEDLLLAGTWSGGGSLRTSYTRLVTRLAPGQALVPVQPGSPAVAPTGCSGDEIDRKRSELVKGGRDFTSASLTLVDEQVARCQPKSPSLQLLWLLNDGAFVAYKLKQLDKCRDYLSRADQVKARVDAPLLPEGLKKALAYNHKICAAK